MATFLHVPSLGTLLLLDQSTGKVVSSVSQGIVIDRQNYEAVVNNEIASEAGPRNPLPCSSVSGELLKSIYLGDAFRFIRGISLQADRCLLQCERQDLRTVESKMIITSLGT